MDKRYKYTKDNNNTVIVISTYAGKTVKGIAKCDPNDKFSYVYGQRLARARCDAKISKKRYKNANNKVKAAFEALNAAREYYNRMVEYEMDSFRAMDAANENLTNILNEAK
jgi:hypothetical protein